MPLLRPPVTWRRDGWFPRRAATAGLTARSLSPLVASGPDERFGDIAIVPIQMRALRSVPSNSP
jgi:hypothetical protein